MIIYLTQIECVTIISYLWSASLVSISNMSEIPNKLVHPSTILVSGPTGSGKTELVVNLIRNNHFTSLLSVSTGFTQNGSQLTHAHSSIDLRFSFLIS